MYRTHIVSKLRNNYNFITPEQFDQLFELKDVDATTIVPGFEYAKKCVLTTPFAIQPHFMPTETETQCENDDSDESPIAKTTITTTTTTKLADSVTTSVTTAAASPVPTTKTAAATDCTVSRTDLNADSNGSSLNGSQKRIEESKFGKNASETTKIGEIEDNKVIHTCCQYEMNLDDDVTVLTLDEKGILEFPLENVCRDKVKVLYRGHLYDVYLDRENLENVERRCKGHYCLDSSSRRFLKQELQSLRRYLESTDSSTGPENANDADQESKEERRNRRARWRKSHEQSSQKVTHSSLQNAREAVELNKSTIEKRDQEENKPVSSAIVPNAANESHQDARESDYGIADDENISAFVGSDSNVPLGIDPVDGQMFDDQGFIPLEKKENKFKRIMKAIGKPFKKTGKGLKNDFKKNTSGNSDGGVDHDIAREDTEDANAAVEVLFNVYADAYTSNNTDPVYEAEAEASANFGSTDLENGELVPETAVCNAVKKHHQNKSDTVHAIVYDNVRSSFVAGDANVFEEIALNDGQPSNDQGFTSMEKKGSKFKRMIKAVGKPFSKIGSKRRASGNVHDGDGCKTVKEVEAGLQEHRCMSNGKKGLEKFLPWKKRPQPPPEESIILEDIIRAALDDGTPIRNRNPGADDAGDVCQAASEVAYADDEDHGSTLYADVASANVGNFAADRVETAGEVATGGTYDVEEVADVYRNTVGAPNAAVERDSTIDQQAGESESKRRDFSARDAFEGRDFIARGELMLENIDSQQTLFNIEDTTTATVGQCKVLMSDAVGSVSVIENKEVCNGFRTRE
ncbi:hypothetical protein CANMA_001713 [Candida margitis]|uniref:uncharacterized protein n=1 Tax=Candida margitis TaxID=1775924 RepID=UPI0022275BC0|nr:uncharacterized protein CANMA_001713 [Candida margitis]KAI5969266.1 hypothetical protein CANMA_001713 [Candida margitis]